MNTPHEPRPRPRLSASGEYIDPVTGGAYMSGNNPSSNQWSAPTSPPYNPQYQYPQAPQFPQNNVADKKVAAGICGIGAIPMSIIGLIEGIIYLTKSDQEFQQQYGNNQKTWF